jgi:hypothetical protein
MACENQGLTGGAMLNDHFHISFVQYVGILLAGMVIRGKQHVVSSMRYGSLQPTQVYGVSMC